MPTVAQVKASFKQTPHPYAHSVTWGWNGPMNQQTISADLDSLYKLGFRVVTIEAGYRMPAAYLSPEWFQLVKTAVAEIKKRGMHVWIIDEGKYPSGFAGGKFSKERPDLRMQALVVYERIHAKEGEMVSRNIANENSSAVALNTLDSSSQQITIASGKLQWTAPKGDWQILLVQPQFKTSVTRAANNPTGGKDTTNSLCDYLSPIAVKQFLDFTHEGYKKYIGDEFGKTILGFRGDEPDFAYLPWTPEMLVEFKKRKGYDIKPWLASFFLRGLSEEQQRAKADYWDVWSDLFSGNFFKLQADWCAANNLEYMVHLNHDDAMIGLVRSEGDFYKDFRSVQIPGIDVIWNQVWPTGKSVTFPKFASSAAHIFGRPRAFSESFAAFTPPPNIAQARWIVNQQFVQGINLFEMMFFSSMSEGKGGARSYMADPDFPSFMQYSNRTGYLLALGQPATQIAVYFPTSSLWLGHNQSEQSTIDLAKQLLESQHDFDFIDDYALTSLTTLSNGKMISKSGNSYSVIIIPDIATLSLKVYNRLQKFAKNGGQVIVNGTPPILVYDQNFLYAKAATVPAWVTQASPGNFFTSLPADVTLNKSDTALRYNHRKWRDAELYFFFNESNQPFSRIVSIAGTGAAQEWNATNGTINPFKTATTGKEGYTNLQLDMQPYETKLITIGKR